MRNSSNTSITPVIGDTVGLPTSGDVHLFPDPATESSQRPIYYADCEGLQGGDSNAAHEVEKRQAQRLAKSVIKGFAAVEENIYGGKHDSPMHDAQNDEVEIKWAGEATTREGIVEKLYPRILFTFSDTVVFVSTEDWY